MIPSGDAEDPRGFELTGELRREAVRSKLFGTPTAPRYLGRFVVHRKLGSGGIGAVFAAYDEQLEREVAIKVLHDTRADGEASAGRHDDVLREARALAQVSDEHVVGIFEVGEADGDLFMVMEYVRGQTLGEWLAAESRDLTERLHVLLDLAVGLCAAHDQGVVHRDVKPANALVDASATLHLVDFGLASVTVGGGGGEPRRVGTPAYAAPEQWGEGAATMASDQFSFCVTMFEALYGERPFTQPGEALDDGATLASPDDEVPPAVHDIVTRGLAAAPDRRWPSMADLVDALRAQVATYESRRSWRLRLAIIAVAIVTTTGGAAVLMAVGRGALRSEELGMLYMTTGVGLLLGGLGLRRHLHAMNVRLVVGVAAVFVIIALCRFTSVRYGLASQVSFGFEFVSLSVYAAAIALTLHPWFGWVAATGVVALGVSFVWPHAAVSLAIAWSFLAVVLMVVFMRRRGLSGIAAGTTPSAMTSWR